MLLHLYYIPFDIPITCIFLFPELFLLHVYYFDIPITCIGSNTHNTKLTMYVSGSILVKLNYCISRTCIIMFI